ncbi:hypothetical protein U5801_27475 [Lamprobacter modestohalophilus]|uniref:hypothetical protein n=1 Tax=Lamprobacter modestohalophilus TaxID=1064514 RepID=UPI002ADEBE94|nr:hypothetical protein [Lamprobacter modestohalophilus]MEA1053516.1 hypothetical protein [Lamprobacter modestohalophilus]
MAKILKIHRITLYRALAQAAEDDQEPPSPILDGTWCLLGLPQFEFGKFLRPRIS